MKTLDEIQKELDRREAPADLSAITIYAKELQKAGEGAASRVSILVAHAKRTIFKDESGFHKWAKESLYFSPNHTSHCAKIGTILLDARVESFSKLSSLPFNKLIALARLEIDRIESLLADKDVAAMTRDQLRNEVRKELGESAPEPKPLPSPEEAEEAKAMEAVKLLASLGLETFGRLARKAGEEDIKALLNAGQKMLGAGVDAAAGKGAAGGAILHTAERVLSIQHKDVRKRLDAMKAANPPVQLETKTA